MRNWAYTMLRKSEGFFKTDMVYLAKGGFWLTFSQILSTILIFVLSIFFANLVPKEVYGNYKFILAISGVIGAFSLTGMGTIVVQAVAKGAEGVFKKAVRTSMRFGLIITGASLITATYYLINENLVLAISMLIASVTLPLISSFNLYGSYLNGKKDFKLGGIYAVIAQGVVTLALIGTILITENVLAMVAVYFVSTALINFILYRLTVSKNTFNDVSDESLIKYGKHVSIMNLFGVFANYLGRILVFHYIGATPLAVYAFAQAIPDQIKGAFKRLFSMVLPKYAVLSEDDLRRSIKMKFVRLTMITSVIVFLYILAVPYIFQLIFPKYMESVIYSQIYVLGMITVPGTNLFSSYFQLKKATRTMYKLSMFNNALTIIITFIAIYNFGLLGAALANGLSWLIMLLAHWYYFSLRRSTYIFS